MEAHDDVHAAWARVLEAWDDPGRHDALFALVVQHQSFAWAAQRYKEQGKERGDDLVAQEQLARLRRGAMATMMAAAATHAPKEKQPYRSTIVVLIVLLAAMLLGVLVTKALHDNAPPSAPTPARG